MSRQRASSTPAPSQLTASSPLLWSETVAPGGYTHKRIARGTRIRLDDTTGEACATVFLANAVAPWERLSVADTQKIPGQAYLKEGLPLLSGDARVLATVVADTSGHHDLFCGTSSDAWNTRKYGDAAPFGVTPSGHGLLVQAAAKHGLAPRDLAHPVSFFQQVRVEQDGALRWTGSAGAGHRVELLAELPLIVLVANVPHPLDPRADYVVGPLRVRAWRSRPTSPTDARFDAAPDRRRLYLNTLEYAEIAGL